MPLLHICAYAGCSKAIPANEKYCDAHKAKGLALEAERRKRYEKKYEETRESSNDRGYGYRWRKAREAYLRRNPLCVRCLDKGLTKAATDVDHIIPHKGDKRLFWDADNWQPLCHECHSVKTANEDGGGWFKPHTPLPNIGGLKQ